MSRSGEDLRCDGLVGGALALVVGSIAGLGLWAVSFVMMGSTGLGAYLGLLGLEAASEDVVGQTVVGATAAGSGRGGLGCDAGGENSEGQEELHFEYGD